VHLARKSVETLLALIESSGQVVTKEDLMATVWPDRIVDEANLAQNIAVHPKSDRGGARRARSNRDVSGPGLPAF